MPKVSVARPRTRIINFRLTEQEYHELCSACAQHGSHSISDFMREAVLRFVKSRGGLESGVERRLVTLDESISVLNSSVGRLVEALKNNGGGGGDGGGDGGGGGAAAGG